MKKLSIAVSCAAALAAALPAAAQDRSGSRLSSVYVGGDIGQSKFKDACNGFSSCDDTDTAWGLFAGYQFNRNLGAEIGYHDLGNVSTSSGDISAKAWEIDAVGTLPLANQFSAYGKLGGYHGRFNGAGLDNKSDDWTWGAGVQWDLTRNVGLRGEFQQYRNFGANDGPNANVVRVGALYRFD